ncbi:MAG: lipopolysaccharide kinase InaA family protein [Bacteroidales bacterium]
MKKIIIKINPEFKSLNKFINELDKNFDKGGDTIKDHRNIIKIFNWDDTLVCVKNFGRLTLFNRWAYGTFRESKAKRSYDYALKLLNLGINSPSPIAYIDKFSKYNVLQYSSYICVYESNTEVLEDIINSSTYSDEDKKSIISQYIKLINAKFLNNGITSRDFNSGNALVTKKGNGQYDFSFVDLNRLEFKKECKTRYIYKMLSNISPNDNIIKYVSEAYAELNNLEASEVKYEIYKSIKKRYKIHIIKSFFRSFLKPFKKKRK